MTRPLLFLDVDGVLNLYGDDLDRAALTEHRLFPEDDEPVLIDPAHAVLLRQLDAAFDIVWATGWNDHAPTLLAPLLGLPPYPVARMPSGSFEPRDKVPVVDAYATGRAAAWIDDLLGPEAFAWAEARTAPTLLLTARPDAGLTEALVSRALDWAATVADQNVT